MYWYIVKKKFNIIVVLVFSIVPSLLYFIPFRLVQFTLDSSRSLLLKNVDLFSCHGLCYLILSYFFDVLSHFGITSFLYTRF